MWIAHCMTLAKRFQGKVRLFLYYVEAQCQGSTSRKISNLAILFVFIISFLSSPKRKLSFLLSLQTWPLTIFLHFRQNCSLLCKRKIIMQAIHLSIVPTFWGYIISQTLWNIFLLWKSYLFPTDLQSFMDQWLHFFLKWDFK